MRRLSILALVAGLVAAGCVARSSGSIGPAPTAPTAGSSPARSPSVEPSGSPATSPAPIPTGRPLTFEVWFSRGGKLFATSRTEPFQPAVGRLSLDALLAGPNQAEDTAGVDTAIPSGSIASIASLSNGLAVVDLSVNGPLGDGEELRNAQIVYTLTLYSTISKVQLGAGGPTFSRKSFEDLLPPIFVESPAIGQTISSPVTITGTANVFEATVSVRVLDENGTELASTFTTASCGTGCRGDYSIAVDYSVDHDQPGTIEVFEVSARDGS